MVVLHIGQKVHIDGILIHHHNFNDAKLIRYSETITVMGAGHFGITYKYPINLGSVDTNTYIFIHHYTNFCRAYLVANNTGEIHVVSEGTTIKVGYFYDPSVQ